jgi:hypothetical protein
MLASFFSADRSFLSRLHRAESRSRPFRRTGLETPWTIRARRRPGHRVRRHAPFRGAVEPTRDGKPPEGLASLAIDGPGEILEFRVSLEGGPRMARHADVRMVGRGNGPGRQLERLDLRAARRSLRSAFGESASAPPRFSPRSIRACFGFRCPSEKRASGLRTSAPVKPSSSGPRSSGLSRPSGVEAVSVVRIRSDRAELLRRERALAGDPIALASRCGRRGSVGTVLHAHGDRRRPFSKGTRRWS